MRRSAHRRSACFVNCPTNSAASPFPIEKLNPNGGRWPSDILRRCDGRYVLTLATELRERNVRYGAAGVCVGSGQGVAIVLENPRAT